MKARGSCCSSEEFNYFISRVSGIFVPVFNYYIYEVLSLIVIKCHLVNILISDL